jgi:hypothetical protein
MLNVNDFVKVLSPFDINFPATHQIIAYSEDNTSYLLDNGIEFVSEYLEKV